MPSFKIGDKKYEAIAPKGKKGRKATGFVLERFGISSGGSDLNATDIFALIGDDEFEDHYMAPFLGIDKNILAEDGTTIEILNGIMEVFTVLMEGMETDEVDAALKNSTAEQEKAEE